MGDGGPGPFGKHLFVGQESSIHVSEEQFDRHEEKEEGRIKKESYDGEIKKTVFYFLNSTLNFFWLLLFLIVPEKAAVDENGGTGDVIRFIGSQEGNDFRDIGGLPEAF